MIRNDFRIEKKFVLGKYQNDKIEKLLLINGFTKIFSPRKIDSIYLDTHSFDFAKDNINGVNKRKKIRFRWYDDDLNEIFLEEKNKQNFQVNKIVSKIPFLVNKNFIVRDLQRYLNENKNKVSNFNYRFVLKTNYLRSYWISNDRQLRATIDTNIKTSSINNLNRLFYLNETILEFKFHPKKEKCFRRLYSSKTFNFRSKKFSKYIQCFNILDDSGLLN
jgi:SPX domain protein involved in polyphosphate accumulation